MSTNFLISFQMEQEQCWGWGNLFLQRPAAQISARPSVRSGCRAEAAGPRAAAHGARSARRDPSSLPSSSCCCCCCPWSHLPKSAHLTSPPRECWTPAECPIRCLRRVRSSPPLLHPACCPLPPRLHCCTDCIKINEILIIEVNLKI